MTYGLKPEGFSRKPLSAILDETNTKQRGAFGEAWDTSEASPDGIMNGIDATQKDELWKLAEALHDSWDPDKAVGARLAVVADLTGMPLLSPRRSVAPGTVNLDAGASLLAQEMIVSVAGNPTARFRNRDAASNGGGTAANVDVTWEAVEFGPVQASTGTLTVIETVIGGVNSAANTEDAEPGRLLETAEEWRIRRAQERRTTDGASGAKIRQALLAFDGVSQVLVYQNRKPYEVGGMPPNCVEAVVVGGDDDEVAQGVFDAVSAGIDFFGNTSEIAVDEEGAAQPVAFTRPVERNVWLEIDLVPGAGYIGGAAVKTVAALYGNASSGVDTDVVLARFYGALMPVTGPSLGIADVAEIRAGFAPSPSGTANLSIGLREVARFDTSRILINGA